MSRPTQYAKCYRTGLGVGGIKMLPLTEKTFGKGYKLSRDRGAATNSTIP
jgi:hypothetical protein